MPGLTGVAPGESAKMAGPEVLETNAKQQDQRYDTKTRELEAQQVVATHQQDIRKTIDWINPLVQELGLLEFMESLRLL